MATLFRILLLVICIQAEQASPSSTPAIHTVNLVADHNSVFRVIGEKASEMDLIAGEPLLLRVEARKAKSMNRDGSIHGLLLMDSRKNPVPGWDLLFKPGIQELQLTAPAQPGIYQAVCTVICSSDHDQMKLRVVVTAK